MPRIKEAKRAKEEDEKRKTGQDGQDESKRKKKEKEDEAVKEEDAKSRLKEESEKKKGDKEKVVEEDGAKSGTKEEGKRTKGDKKLFIGAVRMAESSANRWCTRLQVCGKKILFKVDTGADVTYHRRNLQQSEVASQADPANDMPVKCKRKAGNNRML